MGAVSRHAADQLARRTVPETGSRRRHPHGDDEALAWGYPFHWEARAFSVPRGTPNVIASTYVFNALMDQGSPRAIDAATACASAIARRLTQEAPEYLGIVLERFPALEHFVDESIYFGDPAVVKEMFEHVPTFYDFESALTGGMSEFRFA